MVRYLLGALRLPNTAFKANAGTDVTTDILFLQKRSAQRAARERKMDGTGSDRHARWQAPDQRVFRSAPEMMLGRMGLESAQYGAAPALIGSLEPDILAQRRLASSCVGLFQC